MKQPTTAFELSVDVLHRALKRFPTLLRHFIRITAGYLLIAHGYLPVQDLVESDRPQSHPDRPRTLAERILSVSQSARDLTSASLSAVFEMALQASEVRIAAGERLWSEGDASTMTLAIDAGRVRCTCRAGGESTVCAPIVLGRLETLAGVPRPYGAVAETELLTLRIQRETFFAVIEAHPDVGMAMLARLTTDLLATGWKELGGHPQRTREA